MYTTGNINRDNACNAEDAALILREAASAGAGGEKVLNRMQKSFADVSRDNKVDSGDAAYIGSGGTENVENYFHLS